MTILDDILEHKRHEVEDARRRISASEMAARAEARTEPPRGFRRTLEAAPAPAVIAELKKRSPSRGEIRPDFDPVECAKAYVEGGAAALSVLTDERFFGGHLDFLGRVREQVSLPLLRKDFIVDRYQIDESRYSGADAVLLIVAALADEELVDLQAYAADRKLDALVEVHDEMEMERALASGAEWIGVNNRNLATFEVDPATTERLGAAVAEREGVFLVAESGIHTRDDVDRLFGAGARAFLVGESLMREPDLGMALDRLRRAQ